MPETNSVVIPAAAPSPLPPAQPAAQTPAPAQAQPGQVGQPQDRPNWLPPKFETPDALAKAYAELETRLGRGTPAMPPSNAKPETPSPRESKQEVPHKPDDLHIKNSEKNQPANLVTEDELRTLESEWLEKGSLGDESYKALEAKGLSRGMIDAYIAGQQAQAEKLKGSLYQQTGGEENFKAMLQWASGSLEADEVAAFNQMMDSRNMSQIKLAVAGLYQRYSAEYGHRPNLVGGNRPAPAQPFRSTAEWLAAVEDPRYRQDPAFREDVANRLRFSNI